MRALRSLLVCGADSFRWAGRRPDSGLITKKGARCAPRRSSRTLAKILRRQPPSAENSPRRPRTRRIWCPAPAPLREDGTTHEGLVRFVRSRFPQSDLRDLRGFAPKPQVQTSVLPVLAVPSLPPRELDLHPQRHQLGEGCLSRISIVLILCRCRGDQHQRYRRNAEHLQPSLHACLRLPSVPPVFPAGRAKRGGACPSGKLRHYPGTSGRPARRCPAGGPRRPILVGR